VQQDSRPYCTLEPRRRTLFRLGAFSAARLRGSITRFLTPLLALSIATALLTTHAQQAGGGRAGGAGGGTGARGLGTAGGSTRQYFPSGTVGDAMISSDPESRRLIVITDDETAAHVSQVVTNLDQPKPQVLIKVVFLEVTYNNTQDIGIEGGYGSQDGNAANVFGLSGLNSVVTNLQLNALGQPIQSFQPTPPGAGLYQVLGQDYQVTLRAIAQAGKTEVLSRPSILTRNNQPATITVGQSVPLVTAVSFNGLTGTPINSITYQSVGIILRVTPFITSDNLVEMIVSPEISQLSDQSVPISVGVAAPVIDRRSADTVVVTPNGQTVIIGGLMRTQKTEGESKIPFLGDIPGLGFMFKRKVQGDSKTELLIFLTPHIVKQPIELAGLSTIERRSIQLAPNAFTQEELDRFIDGLPAKQSESNGSKSKKKKR
jgi:general secretion pathway protein D